MSVEDPGVVDIISLDKQTGCVTLTISDHLDWTDTAQHERLLEEKLNKYLAFVESGEILERYPEARGRAVKVRLVFMHRPDRHGQQFLTRARQVIESAGIQFEHELFAESYNN